MTAASSSASQHIGEVSASQPDLTEVWTRIHKFGRFPKRVLDPQSEAEHEENTLFNSLYDAKKLGIPDDVWFEMRNYGASQPVDATQLLIDDLEEFGNTTRKRSTDKVQARRVRAQALKDDRFNDAQKSELEQLKRGVGAAQPDVDRGVGAAQPDAKATELLDETVDVLGMDLARLRQRQDMASACSADQPDEDRVGATQPACSSPPGVGAALPDGADQEEQSDTTDEGENVLREMEEQEELRRQADIAFYDEWSIDSDGHMSQR